jgi:hypothetical protein
MPNYTGSECIVCNEKFRRDSDIVVCPDCGTPYHRECYKEVGKCINDELHNSNGSWHKHNMPAEADENKSNPICKACGHENNSNDKLCCNCGAKLVEDEIPNIQVFQNENPGAFIINFNDRLCGFNPNEDLDGVTMSEMADFIGENTFYYLPIFKRIKDTGKKMSFNLTCLFFPQYYFANRRMNKIWICSLLFLFAISIPSMLYTMNEMYSSIGIQSFIFNKSVLLFCNIIRYAFSILMCFFGNWFYYKFSIKKIKEIKRKYQGNELKNQLQNAGGIQIKNIAITFILYFILCVLLIGGVVVLNI